MGTPRSLLLADDSITIQKVVRLTFDDEGFDVTTVGDGDLAIEKIEELIPDIVLADVHMPGLNGYEVCEFVKRNERFRHIPVMLLVGSFEPYDEAEARRVGADDHLTKPFQSIRQLVNRIGAMLSGKSAEDETPTMELDRKRDTVGEARELLDAANPPGSPVISGAETLEPDAFYRESGDDAFADPSLDDAMIEATQVGDVKLYEPVGMSRVTTPLSSPDFEPAGANRTVPSTMQTQDTLRMQESELRNEGSAAVAEINEPARFASGFVADDALLDLGDAEPQLNTAQPNEVILDLGEETPALATLPSSAVAEGPVVRYDGDMIEDSSSAALVAQVEPGAEATPESGEKSGIVTVHPPLEAQTTSPRAGLITLDQLSPEVIDAIARRAVEQLSEKVVEQIAWEVVPELAERMIKHRLEQEDKM